MGLFSRKKKEPEAVLIPGPDTFMYNVVGESHYNANLRKILRDNGYSLRDGGEYQCLAGLIREPDNAHDSRAVMVVIEGMKVGYIPRADAQDLAPQLDRFGTQGKVAFARAVIGWSDPAIIGVRLDLEST